MYTERKEALAAELSLKHPAVLAVSGVHNSGKTTLLEKLIPLLRARGLKVGVIKHDGHDFTPDVPGTDSYRLREAGAEEACVLITDSWAEIAEYIRRGERRVVVTRETRETQITVRIDLDGRGFGTCGAAPGDGISTGLRFLDHMLTQIAHHGGVSLTVEAHGDLDIDEHHTMEDVAIVLGEAIDRALGSKAGIGRYGFALPMDDCRALVLLDFGGRIDFEWDAEFRRERVGDVPTEMFRHFFHSLCCAARCNLQISARGGNDHHKAEAIFKAFARALRMAVARTGFGYDIPSSKGIL